MPSARVYATAIVGFVTLAANGIVLALHCAKGTTRSRKNDVVVGANVLMDMLQSSRNVLFGVYVLGVYAQFSCKLREGGYSKREIRCRIYTSFPGKFRIIILKISKI